MSRFTKFNRTQKFTIDKDLFEKTVNGKYLNAEDIFKMDMDQFGEIKAHELVGAWKHTFSEDQRIPGSASYKYTIGIKLEVINKETGEIEPKYYYVNAPQFMNEDFDAICNDSSLVREINSGRCSIAAYEYEARGSVFYAFEFC